MHQYVKMLARFTVGDAFLIPQMGIVQRTSSFLNVTTLELCTNNTKSVGLIATVPSIMCFEI